MSYYKISWSLEAARLDAMMIALLWNVSDIFTGPAVDVPVKLQSDWKSLNTNLGAPRLGEILW